MINDPKSLAAALQQAIQLQPGERLYGIVDGAQDLDLAYEAKCRFGQEMRSLFEGDMAAGAADVAPYLVPIAPAGGYLETWARHWGRNAGILLATAAEPARLHAHLRKILVVRDEQEQQYFFRYYDPRVLRAFLPTCTNAELLALFGPIRCLLAEDAAAECVLCFSAGPGGLVEKRAATAHLKSENARWEEEKP